MEGHVVKGVGQSLKLSSEFYSASLYVFQFSSVPQAYLALCNLMDRKSQASLSVINPWGLLKCMSIESVMPSSHIILCHPLLLPPSIFRSIDVFSNESFASGGQSIRVSASASVLPMNTQDLFPLGLTGWISLQYKGLSTVFSNTTVQKHQFFGTQPSLWSIQLSRPYTITGKTIALTIQTFFGKVMSLLFNTLSRFVIAFLPRSKRLLILWLLSLSK